MSSSDTTIATTDQHDMSAINAAPVNGATTTSAGFSIGAADLDTLIRVARLMAASQVTVPKHLQGNDGDCLAIAMQAAQWKMIPHTVAQKTHTVGGTLAYEAQLVNAVVSSSSLLSSRIDYEEEGNWAKVDGKKSVDDSLAITVIATLRGESKPRRLRVSMAQVGTVRNSPLWVSDPRQQLSYLAVKKWARLHAPDVLLGVYTPDELQDGARIVSDVPVSTPEDIRTPRIAAPAGPILDDVLTAIDAATDAASMETASDMAKGLARIEDKAAARSAWAAKRDILAKKPTTRKKNPEVQDQAPETDPTPEQEDLFTSLMTAAKTETSKDGKSEIANLANGLPDAMRDQVFAAMSGEKR